jgi:phospholipid/cholesterol/gamma-HCH transport system substrate-binding protein
MVRKSSVEILVGIFMIAGAIALTFLALRVSGLTEYGNNHYYVVTAEFDNIGSLKPRAPVTIGGVNIGRVGPIMLDPKTFQAKVNLLINVHYNDIPDDSTANILTQGLLGSNYISLSPGFNNTVLKNGSQIQNTHSAIILENLIGQLMYSLTNDKKKQ